MDGGCFLSPQFAHSVLPNNRTLIHNIGGDPKPPMHYFKHKFDYSLIDNSTTSSRRIIMPRTGVK